MADHCLFCEIAAGRAPARAAYETPHVVAFYDLHPQARVHLLIVPREHIPTVLDFRPEHGPLLVAMVDAARELVGRLSLGGAYRLVFNGGRFQHVPHVHWHLLSP